MTQVASFVVDNNKNAFFFCPMRLRSLDSGRLFSANTAFRDEPFIHLYAGDFAEPFSPPLRASLRARRSSLRRAPRHSKKLPSPPFEAARPLRGCGYFLETLRSGASVRLTPYSPLRVLYYLILAALACPAIALATAEAPAGARPLHLPGIAGLMLHVPGLQQKNQRLFVYLHSVGASSSSGAGRYG